MGNNCCKKQGAVLKEEEPERDIEFRSHSSNIDKHYSKIEKDYNFLKFLQLYEFLLLLTNFKDELQSNDHQDKSYLEEFDKLKFTVFLENKILKNHLLFEYVAEDERRANIFKDYMQDLFDAMIRAYIDLYKKKHPEQKIKKGQISTLKRLYLIPIGLLYCQSNNRAKVGFFYNLFADETGLFTKSELLEDFLYFLFIIPSTTSLRALKALSDRYDNLEKINEEDYIKIIDQCEVKDILRLKDIFLNDFFKDKNSLTKREFEDRFVSEDFGWIFNPNGIRLFLEKNNDIQQA